MNMGMEYGLRPQLEVEVNDKKLEYPQPIQKVLQKIRIYEDKENGTYYLDYYTFESLATKIFVDGIPMYHLGNNVYKGDLGSQSIKLGQYSGLLQISSKTCQELVDRYRESIEFVKIEYERNREVDYEFEYKSDNMNKFNPIDEPNNLVDAVETKDNIYGPESLKPIDNTNVPYDDLMQPLENPIYDELNKANLSPVDNQLLDQAYGNYNDLNVADQYKL